MSEGATTLLKADHRPWSAPMSKPPPKTHVGGRDARDGKFVPLKETYRRPDTTTRERIPNPGQSPDPRPSKKDGK